jgi:hypothetical protein
VVDAISSPNLMARATYPEQREAFERYTRPQVAEQLARVSAQVRAHRYPAGRPYLHVNGFTKIVIAEHSSGARLTLHYWPAAPGTPDDVSRPHDHRFPFSSILLGGRQRFIELEESDTPDAERWQRFQYRPYLAGRLAAVAGSGEVGLRQLRIVDRKPLDRFYSTSSAVVHQAVTNRDTACATLVLRGPREKRTSHVYYRPGEQSPRGGMQFGRRIAHEEVVRQLDHAVSLVPTM